MPDGQNHGLHNFLVQIRNQTTLSALPGVLIGDMGPKIGLNGIDNGFLMFDQFRVRHTPVYFFKTEKYGRNLIFYIGT